MNEIQDAIIAGRRGIRPLILHPADGRGVIGDPQYNSPAVLFTSGAHVWHQTVPIEAGSVVRSIAWTIDRNGGTFGVQLNRSSLIDGSVEIVDSLSITSGAFQRVEQTFDHVVDADFAYYAQVTSGAAGDQYFGAVIRYDRP